MKGNNTNVRRQMANLENYGYSDHYGLVSGPDGGGNQTALIQAVAQQGRQMAPNMRSPVNYSVNPAAQAAARAGRNTLRITITCAVTGTGSGNDYNPINLFGGDAFNNATKGYAQVNSNAANLTTNRAFTNGKNVITFKFVDPADDTKYSTYTVTLATAGEYPFVLSSLTGDREMFVTGAQLNISDSAEQSQLANPMETFWLDEFGKSESNDLSVPPDLYQQQDNGLLIPGFPIGGRKGLTLNVNDVNGFSVSLYCYIRK